jgi:hypothetical protein
MSHVRSLTMGCWCTMEPMENLGETTYLPLSPSQRGRRLSEADQAKKALDLRTESHERPRAHHLGCRS